MKANKDHLVLIQDRQNKLLLIGNGNGEPMVEKEAEKLAKKYINSTFNILTAIALPITPLSIANAPVFRGKGKHED